MGKIDRLSGFKENVIMGHLIPAGTGFTSHRAVEIEFTVEEPEPIAQEEEATEESEGGESAPLSEPSSAAPVDAPPSDEVSEVQESA